MSDNTDDTHCWRQVKSQLVQGTWQEAGNAKHNYVKAVKSSSKREILLTSSVRLRWNRFLRFCIVLGPPLKQGHPESCSHSAYNWIKHQFVCSIILDVCITRGKALDILVVNLIRFKAQSVSCSATDMQNLTNSTNQIPSLADFPWTENGKPHLHHLNKQNDTFCMFPTGQETLDAQNLRFKQNQKPLSLYNFLETVVHLSPSSNELTFLGFPSRLHKS